MTALAAALALALASSGPVPEPSAKPSSKPAAKPDRAAARPSRGDARTKPPPPTHVDAATADYQGKDRKTILTGQPLVTFTREDAVLVCKKAVAESDAAGEIERAICEGDVKLTRGEKIVTCKRATFEAATGKVICRGDPVMHDGATVLYCDELVYDLDRDRVSATRVHGTVVQKPGEKLPVHGRNP